MPQDDYASKAHAVQTNWRDISPNTAPSPQTQAIFDALTFSPTHSDSTLKAPNGHHIEVMKLEESQYQTLYFTRELTETEKTSINQLFETLRREYRS